MISGVRFANSQDGTALAWTRSGRGRPLVKAANWLTHLEYDRASPVWSHWVEFLESRFDYIRFDERGCGMSDHRTGALVMDTWVADLEAVVGAADPPRPFVLLGISQGASVAISYAVRHPEDVSHLILYGGYARGHDRRGQPGAAALYRAIVDVFRLGWGEDNPAFRQVFTQRFVPDATEEQLTWYNELCQRSMTPEHGAELLLARAEIDVTAILGQVRVPTLVAHAVGDIVVPLEEGALLARQIPGAEFVVVDSGNHILQAAEPAWADFRAAVLRFVGEDADAPVASLTAREREILRLICHAKSNKDIARALDVSEKTVRNHATHLFAKLGVASRAEAALRFSRHFEDIG